MMEKGLHARSKPIYSYHVSRIEDAVTHMEAVVDGVRDLPLRLVSAASSWTESAVMEIEADRTCYASASSVFAASGPQGWAELPDDLVQSIIALLGYFRDLLAFVGTCRPWHDLLSAHTSSLQPLLLHPTDCTGSKRSISCYRWTLFNNCEWRLADPSADAAASCRSLLSLSDLRIPLTFLHYSHGHLIFCCNK